MRWLSLPSVLLVASVSACSSPTPPTPFDGGVTDAAVASDASLAVEDAARMRLDADRNRDASAGGSDAGLSEELPVLGHVTLLTESCPRAAAMRDGQRCEYVEVDCSHAGTTPTMRAELRITEPTARYRGTVWLGSGSQGGGFYAGDTHSYALVDGLAAAGFRVVERAWDIGRDSAGGWFTGETGTRVASCRSGTLFGYVHDHLTDADAPFCASANSGGSMELAYILSIWRGDRFADLVMPTSGPAFRNDLACAGTSDPTWVSECESIRDRYGASPSVACELDGPRRILDQSWGGEPVCTMASDTTRPMLLADSPTGVGATAAFGIPFRFLYGGADGMGAVTLGIAYAEHLQDAGTDVRIEVIPDGIHDMGDDPYGSVRLLEILRDECIRR